MSDLKKQIDLNKLPSHIAIIMDGNGRWAVEQGKDRIFGHQQGVQAVRKVVENCANLGVKYLTLYAFSTENWQRPRAEVNALMELLVATIQKELKTLHENKIRLNAIGDLESLPPKCHHELLDAIKATSNNTGLNLVLALSYSSRWDIANAVKKICTKVRENKLSIDKIDEHQIKMNLTTASIPDPELLIRTSGESRISNFLLWELAYTELYFSSKMWPEFDKNELYRSIIDFQGRERRFGKTSEQIIYS